MKRIAVFILLLDLTGMVSAQDKQDAENGNVCYTESVEVEKGTSFPVKVFVNNVDTLGIMQVPIYYRSEDVDLQCDSITFGGSRCKGFSMNYSKIEPEGKVAFFAFFYMTDPEVKIPPLYPGDGLVATLWFTAGEEINSGKVKLDSGIHAFYPHEHIDYGYLFGTPRADQKECEYRPGYITVK